MKKVFYLVNQTARMNCQQAIALAPDDYRVEIRQRTRSLEQNSMLWSLLTSLSKQLQWPINGRLEFLTPEDWKDIMTASLHQEQRIATGARGGFVMLGRRTSKMTIANLSELIEFVVCFASEHGVTLEERGKEIPEPRS